MGCPRWPLPGGRAQDRTGGRRRTTRSCSSRAGNGRDGGGKVNEGKRARGERDRRERGQLSQSSSQPHSRETKGRQIGWCRVRRGMCTTRQQAASKKRRHPRPGDLPSLGCESRGQSLVERWFSVDRAGGIDSAKVRGNLRFAALPMGRSLPNPLPPWPAFPLRNSSFLSGSGSQPKQASPPPLTPRVPAQTSTLCSWATKMLQPSRPPRRATRQPPIRKPPRTTHQEQGRCRPPSRALIIQARRGLCGSQEAENAPADAPPSCIANIAHIASPGPRKCTFGMPLLAMHTNTLFPLEHGRRREGG